MSTTPTIIITLLSLVSLGSTGSAATCPFSRPPNPPLPSWPIIGKPNSQTQTLFTKNINGDLLVGSFQGLYTSKDSGKTFTTLKNDNGNWWGGIKTTAGTYLAGSAAFQQDLWRSVDGGKTFTGLNVTADAGYPLSSTAYNMFAQSGNQIIWGTQNGFYISTDEGAKWQALDCSGLFPLSSTPNQTINSCQDLFVRTMAVSPDSTSLIAGFSALGLSGLYSLSLPIQVANGSFAPKWSAVIYNQLCPQPAGTNDGTSLCSDTGPIAFFKGGLFVGSGNSLLRVPYPVADNKTIPTTVLTAANTNEVEMQGLSSSLDNTVLVVSWTGSIYSSTTGLASSFVQPDRSGCSNPNLFNSNPTNPQGSFSRSIAPVSASAGVAGFIVGTQYGAYVWNVQHA
ncbi:hypothetical protein HDU76_005272 [Blyttiomyces sp. JEL0837]|nr:hypothetical protein HDU76_005272 [Blyttiomyces sp. JEL0837]